ncbi:MAG TPA: hypothetical protein VJ957_12090, partial [Longimicrobiales bacterium]|nr:hypothetical protein [Longimicrobiales bacterium]
MRIQVLILPLAILAAACATPERSSPTVTRSNAGDTIVITSHDTVPVVRAASVRIVWQSPDLEAPGSMALVGGRLVAGDRTRFHVIDTATAAVTNVGRNGQGPGEFGSVSAVATWHADSIAVYDDRLQRLSIFTPDLAFARSMLMTPHAPFVNPRRPRDVLRPTGSGVFVNRRENVHTDRPTRSALEWVDPAADTTTVLRSWPDMQYQEVERGILAPTEIYGPHLVLAVSPTHLLIAHGQGVDYCITVEPLAGEDTGVRR